LAEFKAHYVRGGLADSLVKTRLEECLQEIIAPIRERRQQLEKDRAYIVQVLKEGTERARDVAERTVSEVKSVLGLNYFGR
jgi:tryptophanyl-tRNA synthetase